MRTILFLLALAQASTAAAELKAGVARVEITPPALMQMYGYANRKCGPANGTHDPLFAQALVLEAGGSRLAIVTLIEATRHDARWAPHLEAMTQRLTGDRGPTMRKAVAWARKVLNETEGQIAG